ncbi:hypothetical protein [Streptomyces rubiginosohelvolus]|uniref:Uncharacterized protein n=1 Tax=Streptomyces rubiginosohelvolus TaxID=67362 RepID=A0ABW6F9H9_9ACTN
MTAHSLGVKRHALDVAPRYAQARRRGRAGRGVVVGLAWNIRAPHVAGRTGPYDSQQARSVGITPRTE